MEPEPAGIARVLLHPVHGALRDRSRSVAERRDAPEEVREVQRSQQLARDFILRRDAERGGASSRASPEIPHVDQPAPRPREHRLTVRAHPHAVHGGFRVRGGDEFGAGSPAGAPRVPQVTSSAAARRDERIPRAGAEANVQEPRAGSVRRRARSEPEPGPGPRPGRGRGRHRPRSIREDVDDLHGVGFAGCRRHQATLPEFGFTAPRQAREGPRDASAVAQSAAREQRFVHASTGLAEGVGGEDRGEASGGGERDASTGCVESDGRDGIPRGGGGALVGIAREDARANLRETFEGEDVRGGLEVSFRVADRRGGGAGGGAAGEGGEHGGIARGDVDAGREGARATRGGVDAEAVVVGVVAEGGDGVVEASGAVGVALGEVDASALVRREEPFPAVDGALDAHQRVRHAKRGALGLGRRRNRGVGRRG